MGRLVIDGESVYELDEECMKEKVKEKAKEEGEKQEKTSKK